MNTECSFVIEQGPRDVTEVTTEQTKYRYVVTENKFNLSRGEFRLYRCH